MEDQILNFETKKTMDRRCEFWLEFENGTKLFAEMIEPVSPQFDMIPPSEAEDKSRVLNADKSKEVVIRIDDQIPNNQSRNEQQSENKSILKKRTDEQTDFIQSEPEFVISKVATIVEKEDYVKDKGVSLTFTYKQGLTI